MISPLLFSVGKTASLCSGISMTGYFRRRHKTVAISSRRNAEIISMSWVVSNRSTPVVCNGRSRQSRLTIDDAESQIDLPSPVDGTVAFSWSPDCHRIAVAGETYPYPSISTTTSDGSSLHGSTYVWWSQVGKTDKRPFRERLVKESARSGKLRRVS
jgi:hypothetical protein